jgi:hypothetical protein
VVVRFTIADANNQLVYTSYDTDFHLIVAC